MSKRLTQEEFIEKAKKIHGDTYDYSKSNYVSMREKVEIICKNHGIFQQFCSNHLQGRGCKQCGIEETGLKNKLSLNIFLKKCFKVHKGKYKYNKVKYENCFSKIQIICPEHGSFWQEARVHSNGHGCSECGKESHYKKLKKDRECFIKKVKEVHGDKYDYSKVVYKNNKSKVIIGCKKHGDFLQKVSSHMEGNGCKQCSLKRTDEEWEEIIKGCNEIHNNKYDYSFVDKELPQLKKHIIICPKHGKFKQSFYDHKIGRGCSKCRNDKMRENPIGWTYTNWEKSANKSKNFDSYKCYIIRCFDEYEEFYKVGRTFLTVDNRFKGNKRMPYNYETIEIIESKDARYICELEQEMKNKNRDDKYTPQKSFSGRYECFSKINIDFLCGLE